MAGESRKRTFLPQLEGSRARGQTVPKGHRTSKPRRDGEQLMTSASTRKEEQRMEHNKPENICYVQETDGDRDILL